MKWGFADSCAITRLTRRWEDKEPFVDAVLLNIAIRARIIHELNYLLRAAKSPPAELHDEIEREFTWCDHVRHSIPHACQTEKLSLMANYSEASPLGGTALFRPFADHDRAHLLRLVHEYARAADEGYIKAKEQLDAAEKDLKALEQDIFGRLTPRGQHQNASGVFENPTCLREFIARAHCLRIVNAWRQRGDFNASLDELSLPPECLIDPFDGQRLRVKRTRYGPIVYSVGWDLKDDGGRPNVGIGPFDMGLEPFELDIHGVRKR